MICARKGLFGLLWKPTAETGDELVRGWETARLRYGPDNLTGKIFGREPTLKEVQEDRSLPQGYWLFELRSESQQDQPDRM